MGYFSYKYAKSKTSKYHGHDPENINTFNRQQ